MHEIIIWILCEKCNDLQFTIDEVQRNYNRKRTCQLVSIKNSSTRKQIHKNIICSTTNVSVIKNVFGTHIWNYEINTI